ncbi:MAG: type II secretion system protein [Lachnospiraceae bacterium]|nr:type II secretion system protein [Lachnospiraceae bacterium]
MWQGRNMSKQCYMYKKFNNSGFSLVELIVTIGIFMTLLSVLVPSFNSILGTGAKSGANKIGVSLDRTKTEAMSRLSGKMHFYRAADGYYYVDYYCHNGTTEVLMDTERVGDKKLTVTYDTVLDLSEESVDETDIPINETGIILTFDRSTGGFYPLQQENSCGAQTDGEGKDRVTATKAWFMPVTKGDSAVYVKRITIARGSKTFQIELDLRGGTYEIISKR